MKEPRVITGFAVNPANEKLEIYATDEPGAGGANHRYIISGFRVTANPSHMEGDPTDCVITFQNGGIPDNGVNGVTQEALLAILIDRLGSFCKGPFPSRQTAIAKTKCEEALHWLQDRTRERTERGVEGKCEK